MQALEMDKVTKRETFPGPLVGSLFHLGRIVASLLAAVDLKLCLLFRHAAARQCTLFSIASAERLYKDLKRTERGRRNESQATCQPSLHSASVSERTTRAIITDVRGGRLNIITVFGRSIGEGVRES